jgi:hypothetical protein
VDATSRKSSEATFKWSGRGGVIKKLLDHTTPSARTNEASRLFLIVQPPLLLLREGTLLHPRPLNEGLLRRLVRREKCGRG